MIGLFKIQRIILIALISTALVFTCTSFSTKNSPRLSMTTYHLGFSVNPGPNSTYITFAILGVNNDKIVSKRFISENSFVRQAMGKDFSPANSVGKNLFIENELEVCFYRYDSIRILYEETEQTFACYTLQDLWTIRYSRNPVCPEGCIPAPGMRIDGWSQGLRNPTWPQLQILQNYGIIHASDFFYGEDMFRLFRDMHDREWIDKYKAAV